MRHLVDSLAWDLVNDKWPCFSSNPQNLRFSLTTDGFNPFFNLSTTYILMYIHQDVYTCNACYILMACNDLQACNACYVQPTTLVMHEEGKYYADFVNSMS